MRNNYKYILFDFFGTLVDYNSSITDTPCGETVNFLQTNGYDIDAFEFTLLWDACFNDLELEADKTLKEFSMEAVAELFFEKLGKRPNDEIITGLIDIYMKEWIDGVLPIEGLTDFLDTIDSGMAIITNTHYAPLVPGIVDRLNLGRHFDAIETSVENGFRKPSPKIFLDTLDKLECEAADALYVGDSIECDYVGPGKIGMEAVLVTKKCVEGVPKERQIANVLELKDYL